MKYALLMMSCFLTILLTGCTPHLTPVETYIHEAGEDLKEDVKLYAAFEDPEKASEVEVDLSAVVADKVGTYEATITYKNKKYPFSVEVVDTTAPDGIINQFVVTCAIDEKILPDKFEGELNDLTSVEIGLRNPTLIIEEEDLAKLITGNLQEADENGAEYVTYMEMIDFEFNEETDTWDESGVLIEELSSEFVPEKTGLYRLEYCAVDEYGNADITFVYVIADLEAPVLNAEDKEFYVSKDFNEYLESLNEGVSAQDNLLFDINSYISMINNEILEQSNSKTKMKITYEVYDLAGNKAETSRNVTAKSKVNTAVGSVYGPKLNQSQLDEVNNEVNNFVNNYITPDMSDYQKVKAANDYLCSTVSYAASWATNGANTAWGALIYHEAQCSGYARAMKALCDGMGIGCYYVHADSAASNPSHQWNVVCVDGNWYICDVQGNDDYNNMTFLVSDDYYSSTFGMSWDRDSCPPCPNSY